MVKCQIKIKDPSWDNSEIKESDLSMKKTVYEIYEERTRKYYEDYRRTLFLVVNLIVSHGGVLDMSMVKDIWAINMFGMNGPILAKIPAEAIPRLKEDPLVKSIIEY
jgi:hypothetical protein